MRLEIPLLLLLSVAITFVDPTETENETKKFVATQEWKEIHEGK